MLKNISKKYLWVLIIISFVSIITSCSENRQGESKNNNLVVASLKQDLTKDTAKNNNQLLDSWLGDYIFTEYTNSEDTKFYEVFIYKENDNYSAKIKTVDEGAGVYRYVQAKIKGDNNHIDIIFSKYLPDETNTDMPYVLGDRLLGFTKTESGIKTQWGKIVNKVDGIYFKTRENSEGYLGHWYTSIPYTGGNSTTIDIKEISNTSVSFHIYFSRTYYYDGTNIKLENNIAKFVDTDGEYKMSGTIEFVNKSVIVNIEKTDLPILKTGKTVFNYKVSEFKEVTTTPRSGATDVIFEKGIELDFGKKIFNTTNSISASLTKPNVPYWKDDGSINLNWEIKGNKLILSPDYEYLKWRNSKIEVGEKYDLIIDEGVLRDEEGNINSKISLEYILAEPENVKINTSGKSLNDFIPKNWKLIDKAKGDLNNDNLEDIAAVIEYTAEHKSDKEWFGQPRILFIIFQNNDGTYELSIQSSEVILRSDMGGVYGDPFAGIKYSRGSIVISSYGGSAWRWGFTSRYRFQNDGWYLIGMTELSEYIHSGESENIDTNCLTGEQIITTIDKNGEETVDTQTIKKQKLEKLGDT